MAQAQTLTARYGAIELPAAEKNARIEFPLPGGWDSVVTHLSGSEWPTGLVLTPVGTSDGIAWDDLPDADTFTALGQQEALNVQGLIGFGVRVSTAASSGFVTVKARAHSDFGG